MRFCIRALCQKVLPLRNRVSQLIKLCLKLMLHLFFLLDKDLQDNLNVNHAV